jgi:hypothetical protein
MVVLGILLGAFASSMMDKSFKLEAVPPIWSARFGKITLPGVLGVSPWLVIPVLIIVFLLLFRWFEKKNY